MALLRSTSCCGMRELYIGNSTPEACLVMLCKKSIIARWNYENARLEKSFYLRYSHVVFTQASGRYYHPGNRLRNYGHKLKDFITTNKLGDVSVSKTSINPNTNHHVTAFVWTINKAG